MRAMLPPPQAGARYRALRAVFAAGLPLAVLGVYVLIQAQAIKAGAPSAEPMAAELRTGVPESVTVVVIVDSMGEAQGTSPELMPNLVRRAPESLRGPQASCFANFTLPCLLTAFEGRQSPFLTALDNFSAEAAGRPNWLASIRAEGQRLAFIGDHTISELYPGTFVSGGSYEERGVDMEEWDQHAYEQALEWARERRHDAILVHIVGTDKVSHTEQPGSPPYVASFRAADQFVEALAEALDLSRDHILVFGDHGHGRGGHHTRDAWYQVIGPRVAEREVAIDQTSLLYLLARLSGVSLPRDYEGALVWEAFDDEEREERWRERQAERWGLADAARQTLEDQLAAWEAERKDEPRRDLLGFLPWWLHLILIGAAVAGYFSGHTPIHPSYVLWQAGWLAAAWFFPTWVPWAALAIQFYLSWPRARGFGGVPALLMWTALALASGFAIPWIFDFFHVKTGASWVIAVWFGATAAVPLLIGAVGMQRLDARSRWSRAALVMLAFAALLPAPGVYYYGVAQSISHLLFGATLLAILLEVRPRKPRQLLLLLGFLLGATFTLVRAGGWEWRYRIQLVLDGWPASAQAAVYGACVVGCAAVWWSSGRVWALVGAAFLALDGWLLVALMEFELWRVAGFGLLAVSIASGVRLLEPIDREQDSVRTAWQVALITGGAFVLLWSATDGFYLRNVKMSVALQWVGTRFETEAQLAAAVAGILTAQYLLIGVIPLIAAGLALGGPRLVILGRWVILVASFKILAQSLQILGVSFVEEAKASELIIQETTGMAWLTLLLWMGLLVVAFYRHASQWVLGRDRVP